MFWYEKFWVKAQIWKNAGNDPLRPTENLAFKNLYSEALYGEHLKWLYGIR